MIVGRWQNVVLCPALGNHAEKGVSQYKLIHEYGIDNVQLHRLRHNMVVKTMILDALCRILDCRIEDIIEYIPDE